MTPPTLDSWFSSNRHLGSNLQPLVILVPVYPMSSSGFLGHPRACGIQSHGYITRNKSVWGEGDTINHIKRRKMTFPI